MRARPAANGQHDRKIANLMQKPAERTPRWPKHAKSSKERLASKKENAPYLSYGVLTSIDGRDPTGAGTPCSTNEVLCTDEAIINNMEVIQIQDTQYAQDSW